MTHVRNLCVIVAVLSGAYYLLHDVLWLIVSWQP